MQQNENEKETTLFTFIEFSRRRSHEHSPSKAFIRLFTLPYKRQGKAGNEWVKVLTLLCEDAVCLKKLVKLVEDVLNKLSSNCNCLHKRAQRGITNKAIFLVYIKLCTVASQIVRTIKNFK